MVKIVIPKQKYTKIYKEIWDVVTYFRYKTHIYNNKVIREKKNIGDKEKRKRYQTNWKRELEAISHINYRMWLRWYNKENCPKKCYYVLIEGMAMWVRKEAKKEVRQKKLLSILKSKGNDSLN